MQSFKEKKNLEYNLFCVVMKIDVNFVWFGKLMKDQFDLENLYKAKILTWGYIIGFQALDLHHEKVSIILFGLRYEMVFWCESSFQVVIFLFNFVETC